MRRRFGCTGPFNGRSREVSPMRSLWLAVVFLALAASAATAQDRRGMRFWNLTLYTITSLQMSPAGQDTWGPDQCLNDRDGTVDHDERLRITGIEPGRYDVRTRRQDRPRLHREGCRGEGRGGIQHRGKAAHGLPQMMPGLSGRDRRAWREESGGRRRAPRRHAPGRSTLRPRRPQDWPQPFR